MPKLFGITVLIMALIIAIVPQFTTCESQGKAITLANGTTVPMKCKWTAQAELGTSVPLFAVGALTIAGRRRESRLSLSLLGIILGVIVMLIPTYLIGVCQTLMVCHTIMQPVLLTAGGVVTGAGLAGLLASRRAEQD
jgi:hypothetical protein